MKNFVKAPRSQRGFTMVEIAFSLAIVAFALVAIMGVLPTGMTVQKDNREDTLVNNDAAFWLETLRSGSKGVDDLVNYVEAITITNSAGGRVEVTNSFSAGSQIFSGAQIIGLLTTPKYTNSGGTIITNTVIARVRAINGPASEKGNPRNEFVFRYELRPETTPLLPLSHNPGAIPLSQSLGAIYDRALNTNLQQLRLTLRWPLFEQGNGWGVGRNRRTVRALVNGTLQEKAYANASGALYTNVFVEPNNYAYVQDPLNTP